MTESNEPQKPVKTKTKSYSLGKSLAQHELKEINELISSYKVFAVNNRAPEECTLGLHVIRSIDDVVSKDRVRRLPLCDLPISKQQVDEMKNNRIIQDSKSPYNSNILLVKKDDGSKRFVLDFKNLNKNTKPDSYPLPNVVEMIEKMKGAKYFTQLDLASGYWAIPLREEDREKTAFSTPDGKYEFLRMPFGLINAQATFQRKIDKLKQKLISLGVKGIEAFVDNIALFSETYEEHMASLKIILQVIEEHHLNLREDKCEFFKESFIFLGFLVDGKTIKPDPKNVDKIDKFPTPKTRKQVQRFLGLANFNRKFFKGMADIAKPLCDLTSVNVPFKWTDSEEEAFQKVRKGVSESSQLYLPDWDSRQFYIRVDASKLAMGAVLFQKDETGNNLPIAYASKSFTKPQINWNASEKEFFAIIWITRKWSVYCTKRPIIQSDHLSINGIRKQKDPRHKFARWISELAGVDCVVQFLKGKENIEADCLSRVLYEDDDDPTTNPDVIYSMSEDYPSVEKIKKSQMECPELKEVITCLKDNKPIDAGPFKGFNNLQFKEGLLLKGSRVIVPGDCQTAVIKEVHGQHHMGAPNTLELLKNRFYWKGMRQQVFSLVKECESCLQCKPSGNLKANLVIPEIRPPRAMLAMDVGSFPPSKNGNNCFLMMLDSNTKFMAVSAMIGQKAKVVESALWSKWFPYFGIPEILISDQGNNMDGTEIRKLCKDLNIKKIRSSVYHPHGNASAERAIGTLKSIMRSIIHSRNLDLSDWDVILPEAVLAANNTVNKSTQYSPFMSMWGTQPRMPVDNLLELPVQEEKAIEPRVVQKNADMNRKEAQASYKKWYDKSARPYPYEIGQEVLLKKNHGKYLKAQVRWEKGPYFITKKVGPANFGISGPDGFKKLLHHDKIRPARSSVEAIKTPRLPAEESSDDEYDIVEFRMPLRAENQQVQSTASPVTTSPASPTSPPPAALHSSSPSTPIQATSPLSTSLTVPYPIESPFDVPSSHLTINEEGFMNNVFAPVSHLSGNWDMNNDSYENVGEQFAQDNNIMNESLYDNAVENLEYNDDVITDKDFEAPIVSSEELSSLTNNRVTTRSRRNVNSEEFLSLP